MANKVVSDAEKHTEAVKSAKEAKKSAEMKAIAQANVNAAKPKRNEQAAAKAERDRSSTFAKRTCKTCRNDVGLKTTKNKMMICSDR